MGNHRLPLGQPSAWWAQSAARLTQTFHAARSARVWGNLVRANRFSSFLRPPHFFLSLSTMSGMASAKRRVVRRNASADDRQRSRARSVGGSIQMKEIRMREHSGAEGKNNNRNPTLRDAEKAKGQSGEAVHGSKQRDETPSRKSTIRA